MRKKIGIFIFSVISSLFLAEIFLRAYFSIFLNYDIEMWRYARLLKMSVNDARSHAHIPGAFARVMGVPVVINSRGLRDREYAYEKSAGITRILVIGDSLTFGFGVSAENTFAKIIERRLNEGGVEKYEIINAGIGNYNTEQELAYFEALGARYQPDLVILGWYINDAEAAQKYPENFFARNSMAYIFLKSVYNSLGALYNPERNYLNYYRGLYTPEGLVVHQKTLEEFGQAVKKSGAEFAVVLLPELHILAPYPFADIHEKISSALTQNGYRVFDSHSAFSGVNPKDVWVARDDSHPNSYGHKIIAEYILKNINFTNVSKK